MSKPATWPALIAAVTLAGCQAFLLPGSTDPSANMVRLGFVASLSGSAAASGEGMYYGAKLALDQINDAGGVNGQRLRFLVRDHQGSDARGAAVALDLVNRGIVGLIGPNQSAVARKVALDVTKAANIAMISPTATLPSLSTMDSGGTFFRTIPSDSLQGKALAKLLEEDGHSKVSILYRNTAYGAGLADTLYKDMQSAGKQDLTKFGYPDDDKQDYPSIKSKILPSGTAIALIAYVGDGASILRDWIASNADTKWRFYFSEVVKDARFAANVNNAARLEGMRGTAPKANGTYIEDFKKAYTARWGRDPGLYDAYAYDATMLAALALVRGKANTAEAMKANLRAVSSGGPEHKGVRQQGIGTAGFQDAVAKLQSGLELDYEGASGGVDLDANGDVEGGTYVVWEWKNGQPVETSTIYRF